MPGDRRFWGRNASVGVWLHGMNRTYIFADIGAIVQAREDADLISFRGWLPVVCVVSVCVCVRRRGWICWCSGIWGSHYSLDALHIC